MCPRHLQAAARKAEQRQAAAAQRAAAAAAAAEQEGQLSLQGVLGSAQRKLQQLWRQEPVVRRHGHLDWP